MDLYYRSYNINSIRHKHLYASLHNICKAFPNTTILCLPTPYNILFHYHLPCLIEHFSYSECGRQPQGW